MTAGDRVELGDHADCGCPRTDGKIRHQSQTCTDPVAARLGWFADLPAADAPQPAAAPAEDYTARATAAVTEAARTVHDFGGWLAQVLAAAAGELGSSDALTCGRPGSWEASHVDGLLKGTVGYDDEYLQLPEWRTRAPQFTHTAYGVSIGEHDYEITAPGHVDPRRFLAAANYFTRHRDPGCFDRLSDWYGDGQARRPQIHHRYAIHAWDSTEQAPKLYPADATQRGAFPITVLEY